MWFAHRLFRPFLNGSNGEWTNTDDIDSAAHGARKRASKEAATNRHRTEPGKYKGKGGPRGTGGRGGAGRGVASGRVDDRGHLIMGGGRGHGPASTGSSSTTETESTGPTAPRDGKHGKPREVKPGSKRRPPGALPAGDDNNEEPDKPRVKTDPDEPPQEVEYWYDQAVREAQTKLAQEMKIMVEDQINMAGHIVPEPEFESQEELVEARLTHLAIKRDMEAFRLAALKIKETAERSSKLMVNEVIDLDREVQEEGDLEIRKRLKERQLQAYLDARDPPRAPEPIPDKLPIISLQEIPLFSESPLCCTRDWFYDLVSGFSKAMGCYEWRTRQVIHDVIPGLQGDLIERPSDYLAVDDDRTWHVKLGYRRTYEGNIYPELAAFLIREYLPVANYTENVLSRMHFDSVKWYEDQSFTAPAHLAVTTNTINWVVVQNQVARARNSARLGLGPAAVVKVPWR